MTNTAFFPYKICTPQSSVEGLLTLMVSTRSLSRSALLQPTIQSYLPAFPSSMAAGLRLAHSARRSSIPPRIITLLGEFNLPSTLHARVDGL